MFKVKQDANKLPVQSKTFDYNKMVPQIEHNNKKILGDLSSLIKYIFGVCKSDIDSEMFV